LRGTFPGGLPATFEKTRQPAEEFSDAVTERLDALDQEFFRYPHPLTDLLFAFVSQHPEEFGEVPAIEGA
jgi:hypothetical protein